jgi:dolichol kinase
MENKFAFELKRKFVHLFSLVFVIVYAVALQFYNKQVALLTLLFILVLFLGIDYFRVKKKKKIPIFHVFWRKKEKDKLGGNVFFIIGTIIVFAVFDFKIALAALLMTTFGDMAGALVGIPFGKHKLKNGKSWEGAVAQFVVDVVIGFFLLENLFIVIGMALVATWVETKLTHVDDNLAIPVLAGFAGMVLKMIL